jgi:hypothetical protein
LIALWICYLVKKAELKLQDATGAELVFADLDTTDAASVDAKVMVDGKPAEGEFLMADGSTKLKKEL